MKFAALALTLSVAAAVPGGWVVAEADSGFAVCATRPDADLFGHAIDVPTAVASVPQLGQVRVTRRMAASCGCRGGQLRCDVRAMHSAASDPAASN